MHCIAKPCPSTACDLLRVPVGELRETSHSICRSVGGNTASVRRLPGQPDACILGPNSCKPDLLLAIYSAYFERPPMTIKSTITLYNHCFPSNPIPTQCHIVSPPRNKKQGTAQRTHTHTHHTLRNILVSPPTTPSSASNHNHSALAKEYEHNPSKMVTRTNQ